MYNVCTLYVQCMYNVCTMYVQCMYNVCTMYVQCMYNVCTLYIVQCTIARQDILPLVNIVPAWNIKTPG